MTITSEVRVGELAAEHPQATRVFHRHGIDFCCGGGRPIGDVCRDKGLDIDQVLAEIREELTASSVPAKSWKDAPLTELIDHILVTFHEPLREELPRLDEMAKKVVGAHGPRDPERLPELQMVLRSLKEELESHMLKEEQILFPLIRRGRGAAGGAPIAAMEHEHEDAGAALRRLRELSDDYTVPEDACTTWRALWHGLESLETAMHEHIHLENNVLFPRALAGDSHAASRN